MPARKTSTRRDTTSTAAKRDTTATSSRRPALAKVIRAQVAPHSKTMANGQPRPKRRSK